VLSLRFQCAASPEPANYLDNYGLNVKYIRKNAVSGVNAFVNKLHENNEKNR
jgi:hypothetical protein